MISSHFIGFSWFFHEKCNGFSLVEPKFQLIFRTTDLISLDVHIFHVEKQNCQLNKQWNIIGHWRLPPLFVYTFLNQIILQKIWESFILASIYSFIFLFFFKQKSKFIWEFQALIPHKLKISFSLHDQSIDISTPVADVAYGFSVLKFFHFVYYQSCHKITNHMNLMADA